MFGLIGDGIAGPPFMIQDERARLSETQKADREFYRNLPRPEGLDILR